MPNSEILKSDLLESHVDKMDQRFSITVIGIIKL